MGVRIITSESVAVLYDSVTDWAFGPVIYDGEGHDAMERAEAFLVWLKVDARTLDENRLRTKYDEWRQQEAAQWETYVEGKGFLDA